MDFEQIKDGFDIAYSRDTINYLNRQEIDHFFLGVKKTLNQGGVLCVQFIEKDIIVKCSENDLSFDGIDFKDYSIAPIHGIENPIHYLNPNEVVTQALGCGLKLSAHKTHIQAYGKNNDHYRIDKYFLFSLNN
jgi:hypothetical protein